MFKKKPNIPPRPKPPVAEQVLDDLKNSPEDDVVFMIMKNPSEYSRLSATSSSANEDLSLEDVNNPEVVYQKVRNFLEVNNNLQAILQRLQEQNEALLSSDVEIKKMAQDIRKQAIDAVKDDT